MVPGRKRPHSQEGIMSDSAAPAVSADSSSLSPSNARSSRSVATTEPGGRTIVNEPVVAKIAGIAARDVAGVHALGSNAARAVGAIRQRLNAADMGQGVSVEVGELQVAADITIVADYPVPLQRVADGVRRAVTEAIETLVGKEVTEVNVTITDVYIPSDDGDDVEARVQ
jgi:uncharacterized alkaline shock family protein YloU